VLAFAVAVTAVAEPHSDPTAVPLLSGKSELDELT
jgi:hypothetical protein